jgi:hypothetical protein
MAAKVGSLAHESARQADLRGSVARDLDAIFAPLPRVARPEPLASSTPLSGTSKPKGRVSPWVIALGVMTLLLAAALILIAAPWRFARPIERSTVPPPAPVQPAAPATPRTSTSAPVDAAPDLAVATPQLKATRDRIPVRNPVSANSRPAQRPVLRKEEPRTTSKPAAEGSAAACPRGATAAWCLRGSVTAADSRLRDAYEDATRAGVNRKILVGIRSDWKHLRGRANKDPEALIRGYALLTQELRAEISRRSP